MGAKGAGSGAEAVYLAECKEVGVAENAEGHGPLFWARTGGQLE